MKVFSMGAVLFIGSTLGALASTIVLKDGRAITGDIVGQDKTKVIVNEGGISLTYYRDEIKSIKGGENDTGTDIEKKRLVEQYLKLFPTEMTLTKGIKYSMPFSNKKRFLLYLKKNPSTEKITEMRRAGMMQYFTSAHLKPVVDFYTSPEWKAFHQDMEKYVRAKGLEISNAGHEEVGSFMRQERSEKIEHAPKQVDH